MSGVDTTSQNSLDNLRRAVALLSSRGVNFEKIAQKPLGTIDGEEIDNQIEAPLVRSALGLDAAAKQAIETLKTFDGHEALITVADGLNWEVKFSTGIGEKDLPVLRKLLGLAADAPVKLGYGEAQKLAALHDKDPAAVPLALLRRLGRSDGQGGLFGGSSVNLFPTVPEKLSDAEVKILQLFYGVRPNADGVIDLDALRAFFSVPFCDPTGATHCAGRQLALLKLQAASLSGAPIGGVRVDLECATDQELRGLLSRHLGQKSCELQKLELPEDFSKIARSIGLARQANPDDPQVAEDRSVLDRLLADQGKLRGLPGNSGQRKIVLTPTAREFESLCAMLPADLGQALLTNGGTFSTEQFDQLRRLVDLGLVRMTGDELDVWRVRLFKSEGQSIQLTSGKKVTCALGALTPSDRASVEKGLGVDLSEKTFTYAQWQSLMASLSIEGAKKLLGDLRAGTSVNEEARRLAEFRLKLALDDAHAVVSLLKDGDPARKAAAGRLASLQALAARLKSPLPLGANGKRDDAYIATFEQEFARPTVAETNLAFRLSAWANQLKLTAPTTVAKAPAANGAPKDTAPAIQYEFSLGAETGPYGTTFRTHGENLNSAVLNRLDFQGGYRADRKQYSGRILVGLYHFPITDEVSASLSLGLGGSFNASDKNLGLEARARASMKYTISKRTELVAAVDLIAGVQLFSPSEELKRFQHDITDAVARYTSALKDSIRANYDLSDDAVNQAADQITSNATQSVSNWVAQSIASASGTAKNGAIPAPPSPQQLEQTVKAAVAQAKAKVGNAAVNVQNDAGKLSNTLVNDVVNAAKNHLDNYLNSQKAGVRAEASLSLRSEIPLNGSLSIPLQGTLFYRAPIPGGTSTDFSFPGESNTSQRTLGFRGDVGMLLRLNHYWRLGLIPSAGATVQIDTGKVVPEFRALGAAEAKW